MTEKILADVQKVFKDTRASFVGEALKLNQEGYCLNTDLPDVGVEKVVRKPNGEYLFSPLEDFEAVVEWRDGVLNKPQVELSGAFENKDHVVKIDDSSFSLVGGSGQMTPPTGSKGFDVVTWGDTIINTNRTIL